MKFKLQPRVLTIITRTGFFLLNLGALSQRVFIINVVIISWGRRFWNDCNGRRDIFEQFGKILIRSFDGVDNVRFDLCFLPGDVALVVVAVPTVLAHVDLQLLSAVWRKAGATVGAEIVGEDLLIRTSGCVSHQDKAGVDH